MSDLNLLDFLLADHRNLLESGGNLQVIEVSQHLSVERDFLYPAIAHHMANGRDVVEELREAERRLEERLRDFEKHPTPEHRAQLHDAIKHHVSAQHLLFNQLRGFVPEADLLVPSESIALSIGGGPTHAHPHLAEGGAIGDIIEDLTSAADHVRDRLHPEHHPEDDG